MAKHDLTLPAIVLVEPQLGENIGSAARVMANFGLTDLRLVAPRDGWPNAKAEPLSAGAFDGVVSVSVFETVGAAVAQCEAVYATTARPRDMIKPVLGADEAMSAIAAIILPTRDDVVMGVGDLVAGGAISDFEKTRWRVALIGEVMGLAALGEADAHARRHDMGFSAQMQGYLTLNHIDELVLGLVGVMQRRHRAGLQRCEIDAKIGQPEMITEHALFAALHPFRKR
jgi:hypothetical protein